MRSVVKGGVSVCVCRVNRAEENENKLWLVGKCARTHACVRMFVHVCMPPPSGLLVCTIIFYFLTTVGIGLLYGFFIDWTVSG